MYVSSGSVLIILHYYSLTQVKLTCAPVCVYVCVCMSPSFKEGGCLCSYLSVETAVQHDSCPHPLVCGCPLSAEIGYESCIGLCLQDGVGLATRLDFRLDRAVHDCSTASAMLGR